MNIRLELGLDFASLDLTIEPGSGHLLFAAVPLAAFCRANELSADAVLADEDTACWLIGEWYCLHRLDGGAADPVIESVLAALTNADNSGISSLQLGRGHEH